MSHHEHSDKECDHVIRHLQRKLKQANATMGKQGQTIHNLRAEMAEIREIHGKIERGDVRRMERDLENMALLLENVQERNHHLNEQVRQLRSVNQEEMDEDVQRSHEEEDVDSAQELHPAH